MSIYKNLTDDQLAAFGALLRRSPGVFAKQENAILGYTAVYFTRGPVDISISLNHADLLGRSQIEVSYTNRSSDYATYGIMRVADSDCAKAFVKELHGMLENIPKLIHEPSDFRDVDDAFDYATSSGVYAETLKEMKP